MIEQIVGQKSGTILITSKLILSLGFRANNFNHQYFLYLQDLQDFMWFWISQMIEMVQMGA